MGNKAAIVTGAGKGIGRATALKLGAAGVAVCCNSVSESAKEVAEAITKAGGQAIFVQGDVAGEADCKAMVAKTVSAFGGLDILVNNAGVCLPGTLENTTTDLWDRTFAVNTRGLYLLTQAALPHIVERKGCIVNNASSAALMGVKDRFAYSASKGAVVSMTRAMAADLVSKGVRVNCICPGTTDTPSLDDRLHKLPDYAQAKAEFISRQPLGRLGTADEIADGIIFLINSTFCTGTVLSVDGGMTN
jgi:NAD(P)-dependent dehydrogenase (short-subunit alcohol dehydrogenase family)